MDDSTISFLTTSSTFHTLVVQADNGIEIKADISTTTGMINLDADLDNAADPDNKISVTDGRTVTSETLLTLEATTGSTLTYISLAGLSVTYVLSLLFQPCIKTFWHYMS